MNIWDFLTRFGWIALIGTLSSMGIAAAAIIGGLCLFMPNIPITPQ